MTLKYYNTGGVNSLIEEFFHLTFDESDLPFESKVLPICSPTITYIYNNQHRFLYKKKANTMQSAYSNWAILRFLSIFG